MVFNRLSLVAHKDGDYFAETYYHVRAFHVRKLFEQTEGPLKNLLTRRFASIPWDTIWSRQNDLPDQRAIEKRYLYIIATLYSGKK